MYVFINALYTIAGLIWGNWRNWKRYYPTILFFVIGDFLYNFLLYKKSMWVFHDLIIPNHTTITILSMVFSYTATVLIYLGKFPKGWAKRFLWFLLWVGIYLTVEFVDYKLGFITYHNGWSFRWSVFFTAIIFFILPIHYKNPLLAWLLSIVIIIVLLNIFGIKVNDMK
ncbi:CBO0543 family protein [Neobacillus endophyticus]|uniref:CBO0543 family protein n=1 Tax=Neobacillus endophyticus TaxID=2738405 RepID=UPI002484214C|nr:CBO0543 family protein [Neobacillus endophyticus]